MTTAVTRPFMVSSKAVPLALFGDYHEAKAYFEEVRTANPSHCVSFKKMHFTKINGVSYPSHQILAFHFAEKKPNKYRKYLDQRGRIRIRSVNVETRKETIYESMEQACKALGLKSPSSIFRAIKCGNKYNGCTWSKIEE